MSQGYPIAYVRVERDVGAEAGFADAVNPKNAISLDPERGCLLDGKVGKHVFIELIYERVPEVALDLAEAKVVRDLVIYLPHKNFAVLVKGGTPVKVYRASGKRVYPHVSEGEVVDVGSRLFSVLTEKLEVRTLRSEGSGTVVYVGDVLRELPQTMIAVVVDSKNVEQLIRCAQG